MVALRVIILEKWGLTLKADRHTYITQDGHEKVNFRVNSELIEPFLYCYN